MKVRAKVPYRRRPRRQPDLRTLAAYTDVVTLICDVTGLHVLDVSGSRKGATQRTARRLVACLLRDQAHQPTDISRAMRCHHSSVVRMVYNTRTADIVAELAGMVVGGDGYDVRTLTWLDAFQVVGVPSGVPVRDPSEPRDTDRIGWDRLMEKLCSLPDELRASVWLEACKPMYPHSWEHQCLVLPHACRPSAQAAQ